MVGAKKVKTLVPCNLIQGVLVFEIRELIFGDFWKGSGFYHLQSKNVKFLHVCLVNMLKCLPRICLENKTIYSSSFIFE
jgi:hypothetical protein